MKDLLRQSTSVDEAVSDLINKQIKMEAQSSYAYLGMAAWCDMNGWENSADFFYTQSDEERIHMLKLFRYLADAGAVPVPPTVEPASSDYASLREVFEAALEAEIAVTTSINTIVSMCRQKNDFATESFMQWFINEQIEEEFVARRALELIDLLGTDNQGLIMFDERVNSISYTPANGTGAV